MTVEVGRANLVGENEDMDQFPIGMRILAVDDDPICLKVLENLLRKCQYHGKLCLDLWFLLSLFIECFCLSSFKYLLSFALCSNVVLFIKYWFMVVMFWLVIL